MPFDQRRVERDQDLCSVAICGHRLSADSDSCEVVPAANPRHHVLRHEHVVPSPDQHPAERARDYLQTLPSLPGHYQIELGHSNSSNARLTAPMSGFSLTTGFPGCPQLS